MKLSDLVKTNQIQGLDGVTPVLAWVGDQITINGVNDGPHLTPTDIKPFAVAMAIALS